MKRFANKVHLNRDGQPLKIDWPKERGNPLAGTDTIDTKTEHIFHLVVNNAPMNKVNDTIQGGRLYDALQEGKDKPFIELEDGVHDWVKAIAETVCPPIFRINTEAILDFIKEGFEKAHQPKD